MNDRLHHPLVLTFVIGFCGRHWLSLTSPVSDDWKQEKRIAKVTGGKRQPGSGSGWLHPNDVKDDQFLREMKQTNGKSISVKGEDWDKLRRNALSTGRTPMMHLQIGRRRLVLHDEGHCCVSRTLKSSALDRLKATYKGTGLLLPKLERHVMRSIQCPAR